MNEGEVWTERNIVTLTDLWKTGSSASEIARAIGSGVSRSAVLGKVHRLKLEKRVSPVPVRPRPPKKVRPAPRPKMKPRPAPEPLSDIPIEPMPVNAKAWEPLPGSTPIPLEKLNEHTCKWPVTPDAPFLFCGEAPAIPGKPYCAHHAARGTVPLQPKLKAPGKW